MNSCVDIHFENTPKYIWVLRSVVWNVIKMVHMLHTHIIYLISSTYTQFRACTHESLRVHRWSVIGGSVVGVGGSLVSTASVEYVNVAEWSGGHICKNYGNYFPFGPWLTLWRKWRTFFFIVTDKSVLLLFQSIVSDEVGELRYFSKELGILQSLKMQRLLRSLHRMKHSISNHTFVVFLYSTHRIQ